MRERMKDLQKAVVGRRQSHAAYCEFLVSVSGRPMSRVECRREARLRSKLADYERKIIEAAERIIDELADRRKALGQITTGTPPETPLAGRDTA